MTRFSNTELPSLDQTRALMHELIGMISDNMERIEASRYDITLKPDGSPVTASDVFIENLIRDHLSARIPDVDFAGEETFDELAALQSRGYYAILDPIDGTENFCSGLKEWGVCFTLWHRGTHLGSMIYLPELREHLMTGDALKPIQSRIRGFSSSMCDEILQGISSTRESRITGCAAYNMYNVVRGAFARFTNPLGAHAWDLLPGLMLALEHGCEVEVDGDSYDGRFLEPGKKYRVDIRHRYDLHPG